jgi:lysophospholipase L1-like esterase
VSRFAAGRLVRRALLGLIIGVVALEAILQVAALLAPLISPTPETAGTPGAVRILLVGDSHAAGAGAAAGQRLSDHLERMLSARHPGRVFEVSNVGRSGVNSAYVANRLESHLVAYRPQVVIVWVGVNDLWNSLETEAWAASDWRLRLQRLLLHSKLYRLLVVLRHTRRGDEPPAAERWAVRGDLARTTKGLAFDLERMARSASTLGTPILFMNYPVPYPGVNATIQWTALRLGVPVVKTDSDVWRAKDDGHEKAELLTFAAGPHPTGLLYRYVAESTVPQVERLLRQAGVELGDSPGSLTDTRPTPSGSSP